MYNKPHILPKKVSQCMAVLLFSRLEEMPKIDDFKRPEFFIEVEEPYKEIPFFGNTRGRQEEIPFYKTIKRKKFRK